MKIRTRSASTNKMQFASVLVLTLTLATCAGGLAITSKANASALELVQLTSNLRDIDPVLVRPNAGKGPDKIHFDMQIMNFYGANLKKHTVALDMAMSIRWKDPRVIALVPKGLDKLSMGWDQALKQVWMPGIVVTNRDIESYEIVSSSVTIFRTGEVLRVERSRTNVMKKFSLAEYPFDTQHLVVNVASSKYMLNEVVLVADNKTFSVAEKVFGLYDVQGWQTSVYEERDGELKKSRGSLSIEVKRVLDKYLEDHLVPTFITLTISWSVFFFPFANPFITPRLALSILALLTFTNIMVKSTKELPGPAPFNWNDLFNQQIQTFMFMTIVFNIGTEIIFHQFNKEALARMMNHESKIFVPFTSTFNIVMILGSAYHHWMSLFVATIVTKLTSVILVTCYFGYLYTHWLDHSAKDAAMAAGPVVAGPPDAAGKMAEEEEADCDCDC